MLFRSERTRVAQHAVVTAVGNIQVALVDRNAGGLVQACGVSRSGPARESGEEVGLADLQIGLLAALEAIGVFPRQHAVVAGVAEEKGGWQTRGVESHVLSQVEFAETTACWRGKTPIAS